jgi:hypothetical protein
MSYGDMEMTIADSRSRLTALRPNIPSIDPTAAASQAERFQNGTLRPLLKFQNDLIVAVFVHYAQERKGGFDQLPATERAAYINISLRKDHALRNLLLGTLLGHFTLAEYHDYLACEKEIRKRAVEMLIQRLQDQLARQ